MKDVNFDGKPVKYKGEWAMEIRWHTSFAEPEPGDLVKVTTKKGKEWISEIDEVVSEISTKGMRYRCYICTVAE